MKGLVAGGVALGVAMAGSLALAGPGAAQTPLEMSLSKTEVQVGDPLTISSVSPCIADDGGPGEVDLALIHTGESVWKDSFQASESGAWERTHVFVNGEPLGKYTVQATCRVQDPEDPESSLDEEYAPASFTLIGRIAGPEDPLLPTPPTIPTAPTTPATPDSPAAPEEPVSIGAGHNPPPDPPAATPVRVQPTFTG